MRIRRSLPALFSVPLLPSRSRTWDSYRSISRGEIGINYLYFRSPTTSDIRRQRLIRSTERIRLHEYRETTTTTTTSHSRCKIKRSNADLGIARTCRHRNRFFRSRTENRLSLLPKFYLNRLIIHIHSLVRYYNESRSTESMFRLFVE